MREGGWCGPVSGLPGGLQPPLSLDLAQTLVNRPRSGLSMVRGGLKDRARPALMPVSCAAPCMAHSHQSRRSYLESLGSQALVDLSN